MKLQYFGHLMQRADSFENSLMLGKIEGGRRKGQQRMIWHYQRNGHEFEYAPGVGDGQRAPCAVVHGVTKTWTRLSD